MVTEKRGGLYIIQLEHIISAGIITKFNESLEDAVKSYNDSGQGEIVFFEPLPRITNPEKRFVTGTYKEPKLGKVIISEEDIHPYLFLCADGMDRYVVDDMIKLVDIIGAEPISAREAENRGFDDFLKKLNILLEVEDRILDSISEHRRRSRFRVDIEKDPASNLIRTLSHQY